MSSTVVASMPDLSREYVRNGWTAKGIDKALLTTLPVEYAFLADRDAEPVDADWRAGEWDPETVKPTARCLIGAGSPSPLADGDWYVWIRVTGAIERPVRKTGRIRIT